MTQRVILRTILCNSWVNVLFIVTYILYKRKVYKVENILKVEISIVDRSLESKNRRCCKFSSAVLVESNIAKYLSQLKCINMNICSDIETLTILKDIS